MTAEDIDGLLDRAHRAVGGAGGDQGRWELLLEAVVSLGAGLDLDVLLERVVAVAQRLVDARYAALGVLAREKSRRLQTFVHRGMDPAVVASIGDLPRGQGLLGMIIDHPEPLRLHDLSEHPAAHGLPPAHPAMHTFLGVPVRVRDIVFGNLYLTEKAHGGDFTAEDERIVVALAAAAGVAIENAQLYDEVRRHMRWQAATAEITGAILAPGSDALTFIAERALDLAEADAVWIVGSSGRPESQDLRLEAAAGVALDAPPASTTSMQRALARDVIARGAPMVVEDLAKDPRTAGRAGESGWPRLGPVILVPLSTGDGAAGVLALAWKPEHADRYVDLDPSWPASFAEQAALGLQISRSQSDRERLVVLEDRDRIARDLHDLVIQRLFALGLTLQGAERMADDTRLRTRLDSAIGDLDTTIKDIRATIFELGARAGAPDLRGEITAEIRRAESVLKFRPVLTLDGPVSTLVDPGMAADLLAVLSEALSNAGRHSQASRVHVSVSVGDEVVLEVVDDGLGLPENTRESGLQNMRDRATRRGGTCEVGPSPGAGTGTRVRWVVPRAG